MPKKAKRTVAIPTTIEEATRFLGDIATAQRHVDELELKLNADIDDLKKNAAERAKAHQTVINDLLGGLFVFAERNRIELTKDGRMKTVSTPMGTFGWRTTPPSIKLRTKVATVIKTLKQMGLGSRFIRTTEEIDKAALLRDQEAAKLIKGITVKQFEEFFVKPSVAEIEEVAASIEKLRKVYAA